MSEYFDEVKRYDPGADVGVVAEIVKHLGIALCGKDSPFFGVLL